MPAENGRQREAAKAFDVVTKLRYWRERAYHVVNSADAGGLANTGTLAELVGGKALSDWLTRPRGQALSDGRVVTYCK